jgi:hypothetical protein
MSETEMVNVRALVAAGMFALPLAAPAGAVTVTVLGTNAGAWSQVDPEQSTALPTGASWAVAPDVLPNDHFPVISPCESACSPFDPFVFGSDPAEQVADGASDAALEGWPSIPFFVAWQADPRQPEDERVTLSFLQTMTSFQFLWGSPDAGNLIEFLLGDTVVAFLSGTQALGDFVNNPGQGAALVRFSDVRFDGLRFSSTSGGFEWANMLATPIPLPPAGLLLLGGLGALGFAARRRKAA